MRLISIHTSPVWQVFTFFKISVFLLCLRCQGAEAFEIQHSGLANGIFMKFLKDRLLEDKKITVLLDEVAEGKIKNKEKAPEGSLVIIVFLLLLCRFGVSICFYKTVVSTTFSNTPVSFLLPSSAP